MTNYVALQIKYDDYEGTNHIIEIGSIEDVTTNLTSEITTYPMVNGDIVADHMINQPITQNFRGQHSLNGSKTVLIDDNVPSIKEFQTRFEEIKENGYLCTLTKVNFGGNESNFVNRSNMVLNSITWIEKINLLDFTFGFAEVILANLEEEIPTVNLGDEYPAITEPKSLNFSEVFMDYEQLHQLIVRICVEEGLCTEAFISYAENFVLDHADEYLVRGTVIGAGAGTLVTWGLIKAGILASGAATMGTGIIVGAVAGLVLFAGISIADAIKKANNRKKFRVKQFELYESDEENRQNAERFIAFESDIMKAIQQQLNSIKVFGINTNEEQECLLSIDDEYYNFIFTKSNVHRKVKGELRDEADTMWNVKVTLPQHNDEIRKPLTSLSCAQASYGACNSNNPLFLTDYQGHYVHFLYNPQNDTESVNDLRNYLIVVSEDDPSLLNDILEKIIETAITY